MTRLLTISLACLLALAAVPAPAAPADNAPEAIQLANQAKAKYAAKQYREAAKLFMDAYAKVAQPSLLFNAGRSYEEAGALQEALPLFELFLSVAPANDVEGRQDAEEHRASISARLKAQAQPTAVAKPVVGFKSSPTTAAALPAQPTPTQAASLPPQPPAPKPPAQKSVEPKPVMPKPWTSTPPVAATKASMPQRQTVWPWVVGGSGVALLITGVVVHATAGSALAAVDDRLAKDAFRSDGLTLHPTVTQQELDHAIEQRDARRVTGGWLIGVGAAATVAGAYLWWREQPTSAWVQPLWGPETTGVAVAGRF